MQRRRFSESKYKAYDNFYCMFETKKEKRY